MPQTNKYHKAIENFANECQKIEGIYDVFLRGTSTDLSLLSENWSDIDFSVVIHDSIQNVYHSIRKAANEISAAFDFKISITIVELSDFIRKNHNHGIKPEYYTKLLGQSRSLFPGQAASR